MDLATVAGEFLADLELLGRAEWTRKKHAQQLRYFGAWIEAEGIEWQAITRRQLQTYARGRAHLGASARSQTICTLRTFFSWAVENEYVAISPAAGFKTPKRPKPLPRALSLDQIRRLLNYLAAGDGRRARRDEALLVTALYTGMRASELAALRWSFVDLAGGVINIRIAKMGKGRALPIHPALYEVLERWRVEQGLGQDAPVFSLTGKRMAPDRVGKVAREAARALHLPLTAHVLRHTFATWALRRSRDLHSVSRNLGHAHIRQTEIYISTDVGDLQPAVLALPQLDSW